MSCVAPGKKSEPGGCKSFKRKLPDYIKRPEVFRYKEER